MKAAGKKVHIRSKGVVWKKKWRKPTTLDCVINWGNSNAHPNIANTALYYNGPTDVGIAINKLAAFRLFQDAGVPIPEFTTDIAVARTWLPNSMVVCRTLLRASGGRGIVLAKTEDELVQAPLYVKYRRKTNEYRVHVIRGVIQLIHEKRLRNKENRGDNFNPYICNHDNNWVFCNPKDPVPEVVKQSALDAVSALHLDFGAVDIIYNSKFSKAYVLEVNTAPGMANESKTVQAYAQGFLR